LLVLVAETEQIMRKGFTKSAITIAYLTNDKALNNHGFVVSNTDEAVGLELMDLLQLTVSIP
jgi:hypothetical protein